VLQIKSDEVTENSSFYQNQLRMFLPSLLSDGEDTSSSTNAVIC